MKLEQDTSKIIALLQSWGLSRPAVNVLSQQPEIVNKLQQSKELPSFAADYIPEKIEEKFGDTTFRCWEYGVLTYERLCPSNYEPPFVEYCFDEQTGLFFIDGEVIVDRLGLMAESVDLMTLLNN